MKITKLETFVVDGGWRAWTYVKVETDEGITGWGECSDYRVTNAVEGMVRDLTPLLIGKDPCAYEMRFIDMMRITRSSPGGITARAIAGIECALVDIAARARNISVVEMLGGPTRDKVRLYWSHCGTTRVRHHDMVGAPPINTWADVTALGKEVVARGFTALKTNIVMPGQNGTWMSGFGGFGLTMGPNDEWAPNALIDHVVKHIGTLRDAVGPDFDINLDLNWHFKPEACVRIAKALEPFNLHWLEIDTHDVDALLQIKQSTSTRICTGETLIHMKEYLPFFQKHAADMFMIDVPWNGIVQGKKVGDLAATFGHNIGPHNHYSHLSTHMSAALCATLHNVRIMEIDIDDVPWKDDLVTHKPEIVDGHMIIPKRPGLGTAIVEEVARAHPWDANKAAHAKQLAQPKNLRS